METGTLERGIMITLELGYVRSLWSLCSVDNLELYLSALVKGFETLHVKAGVVNEHIVSLLVTDKSVALLVVEPLY